MFRSRYFGARFWSAFFFGATEEDEGGGYADAGGYRRPSRSATVTLKGATLHLGAGEASVSAGATVALAGATLRLAPGRIGTETIQNPTDEEMVALLALDAVSGE